MRGQQAIILAICISILLAGAISLYIMQNYVVGKSGQQSVQKTQEIKTSRISIESAYGSEIVVRNIGEDKIQTNNITLKIGNEDAQCIWDMWVIVHNEVASCALRAPCTGMEVSGKMVQMPILCS
jgi:hypothetical protein